MIVADSSSYTYNGGGSSNESDDDDEEEDERTNVEAMKRRNTFKQQVANLLPRTKSELIHAIQIGNIAEWNLLPKPDLTTTTTTTTGLSSSSSSATAAYCLDTIKPVIIKTDGSSSGSSSSKKDECVSSGVVTTRSFEKGDVVTVSPLIFIENGTAAMEYDTYHYTDEDDDDSDVTAAQIIDQAGTMKRRQPLTNYCWNHRHHHSMLCPTTYAGLIRHGGSRNGSSSPSSTPNIKIQWLELSSSATSGGRHRTRDSDVFMSSSIIEGVAWEESNVATYSTYHGQLAFQYVALRPIDKGEELFVDYGESYDNALKKLSEDTRKKKNRTSKDRKQQQQHQKRRPSARQLNAMNERPVPSNSTFVSDNQYRYECQVYPNMKIQEGKQYSDWENWNTNRMIDRSNWPKSFVMRYGDNEFASWYPCHVVNVVDGQGEAVDVEILNKGVGGRDRIIRRLRNFPRERIRWVDGPYQSSLHSSTAIRHSPTIPDEIFPFHWRDDYRSALSWNLGASATSDDNVDYETMLRQAKCGMYLAPSNIPGAGYGVYTGVDVPAEGVRVGSSVAAVLHHGKDIDGYLWQGKDYTWNGGSFYLEYDGYPEYEMDALTGLCGGMSNFHTGLVNVELVPSTSTPLLDARTSPGAGAYSDYANTSFASKHPIEAGEELFISYGEHWLETRESFRDVPLKLNYKHADVVASSIWSLLNIEGSSISEQIVPRLLSTIQQFGTDNKRTKSALNFLNGFDKLNHVIERNGTAKSTVTKRSQEWFDENGFCQDHIYLGRSTLPDAGNGAFTRRFIPKGSLIIASPLVTAPRVFMDMNYTMQREHPINEKHLMMNYHFGHKNSTILLFPLTQATSINHNTLTSNFNGRLKAKPNARVELSSNQPKSQYLLQRSLSDIFAEKYSSLFLNVIAERDIDVDEEVFIDYGKAWEAAWQTHVNKWKPPCGSTSSLSCAKSAYFIEYGMGNDPHNPDYHRWSDQHHTVCRSNEGFPWKQIDKMIFLTKDVDSAIDDDQVHQLEYDGFTYAGEGFQYPFLSFHYVRPCQILRSDPDSDTFDVVYFLHSWQIPKNMRKSGLSYGTSNQNDGDDAFDIAKAIHVSSGDYTYDRAMETASPTRALVYVKSLHRNHVRFTTKPLSSDCHSPHAFRHEIHIPDESFPDLWKDLV